MYAWLKQNGIGKEDVVVINLTRGVIPVVAIVGILKAGKRYHWVKKIVPPKELSI